MSNSLLLSSGRNLLLDLTYNASTSKSQITKFKIGTGTTDPLVSDTALETEITAWTGGSSSKTFVSGFPSFDTTNNEVTIKGFVASTEANGNNVSEFGTINTDGSEIMDVRSSFTPISKTSTDEITFTSVLRLREPEA